MNDAEEVGGSDDHVDADVDEDALHVCRDQGIVNLWMTKNAIVEHMVMGQKKIPDQLMPIFAELDNLAYLVNLVGRTRNQCCTAFTPEDVKAIEDSLDN